MLSDLELIERFRQGSQDAFEQLIVRYEKKIYTTCFYFMKNREDAEDVAQDVIIKLYRKLDTFRREASFSTWMNYVAANTCRDALRKRKRERVLHLDRDIQTEEGTLSREIPSDEPTPEEQFEGMELKEIMQTALGHLQDDHREILLMREYQTLAYEEIADILQISIGTVKSRIHRARRELKALLGQSEQLREYARPKDR